MSLSESLRFKGLPKEIEKYLKSSDKSSLQSAPSKDGKSMRWEPISLKTKSKVQIWTRFVRKDGTATLPPPSTPSTATKANSWHPRARTTNRRANSFCLNFLRVRTIIWPGKLTQLIHPWDLIWPLATQWTLIWMPCPLNAIAEEIIITRFKGLLWPPWTLESGPTLCRKGAGHQTIAIGAHSCPWATTHNMFWKR